MFNQTHNHDIELIVGQFRHFKNLLLGSFANHPEHSARFQNWVNGLDANQLQFVVEMANHFAQIGTALRKEKLEQICLKPLNEAKEDFRKLLREDPTLTNFFNRHLPVLSHLGKALDGVANPPITFVYQQAQPHPAIGEPAQEYIRLRSKP